MSNRPTLTREGDILVVAGDLTMQVVGDIVSAATGFVQAGVRRVDLSGVARVDSAGLALVFDLVRAALKAGGPLIVVGAPADLGRLARLYGINDFLPMFCSSPVESSRA